MKFFGVWIMMFFFLLACSASSVSASGSFAGKKIVLIPLDSRPVNTEYIKMLSEIGGASVVYPEDGLDHYERPSDYAKIKSFLIQQLPTADAVFICVPQWLNGSLIEGRHAESYVRNAYRLAELQSILSAYKYKTIYLIGLIPREKPSYITPAFKYSTELTQYGRKYAQYMMANTVKGRNYMLYFLRQMQNTIPFSYVRDYLKLFNENTRVLYTMADWAKAGLVDGVVIGLDDTSDMGLPKFNEMRLLQYCKEQNIRNVYIMPGADDITALLLARYKNELSGSASRYDVTFSHEQLQNTIKAYDGQPLAEVIRKKIAFVQPKSPASGQPALLSLYVHSHEEPIENLQNWIRAHPNNLRGVADVSYASFLETGWMENYLRQKLSSKIHSYAAWNTSGNTIGLLVAHLEMIRDEPTWNEAHERWLALRYAEDYYYNTIKRYEYALRYSSSKKVPPLEEKMLMENVTKRTNQFLATLSLATRKNGRYVAISPAPRIAKAELPWHRIFEIGYTFR
ncbi:Protein of unknown function [Aneurinibacillus thermoaerophilus]|uniref:DUF4127 family protein n=2 Tax=Aneurinibacillus thermoaerophilus TaxID=143495 RepID=A0A1G7YJM7_ANETH|nr:DUF4127 family protein [Aneurinibacillus thermoaerophilus]AMA73843.1 hypothetical protein ACH33_13905 [Aneurinibacillus sp. XH2]MED0679334.1 DUF4127 family protein [Aneurinibacillus thermoaerophilus]MED0764476.1 DUF4127 family protein [Aneurinibacillus thermoaerophilus]SDG96752.1 Protein of unknown function [Aneurinibacillus thermoaerophilus]